MDASSCPRSGFQAFVTVRRGGSLQDDDHRLLAGWAADCAQHVLHHFERARPGDDRPRRAIDLGRAWARGEVDDDQARSDAGHANAAARELSGAARHAAHAAGQAGAVAHVAAHEWVPPPMPSRQRGRRLRKASAMTLVAGNASGSAPTFPTRSELSCSTTSGCATSCAGSSSIADRLARAAGAQPAAFLASSAIRASTAGVSSITANSVGHISPSSRLASGWKPKVE